MPVERFFCTLCVLAFVTATAAQCDLNDLFSGDTLSELIADAIVGGDAPEEFEVTVSRTNVVCLSVGSRRETFTTISILVNYACSGSGLCPVGTPTEQFDFGCTSSGEWTISIGGGTAFVRDENPLAEFTTDNRIDCFVCLRVVNPSSAVVYDNITHCHVCPDKCASPDEQNACIVEDISNSILCCNVYFNDECAEECPNNYEIDPVTYECLRVCPPADNLTSVVEGTGMIEYSQPFLRSGYPDGTTASVVCNKGYSGGGGSITCQSDRTWSGILTTTCEEIDCGELKDPLNGKVLFTKTTYNSVANYTCEPGYTLDKGSVQRICLLTGMWSGEEPTCAACPDNCVKCDTDVNLCQNCSKETRLDKQTSQCVVGDEEDKSDGGLDIGAIIGLILAAIVLALLATLITVTLIMLYRRRVTSKYNTTDPIKPDMSNAVNNRLYVEPEVFEDVDRGIVPGKSQKGSARGNNRSHSQGERREEGDGAEGGVSEGETREGGGEGEGEGGQDSGEN